MTLTQTPFVQGHKTVGDAQLRLLESAGQQKFLSVYNGSGSTVYIHFFDNAPAGSPVNGNTPSFAPIPIAAGNYYESDTVRGFVNGCWIAVSSSAATLTIAGTDVFLDAGGLYN